MTHYKKNILITGGSGFIGSNLIHYLIKNKSYKIFNIDKLSYASNSNSLEYLKNNKRYFFSKFSICNKNKLKNVYENFKPNIIINLAAESHVDNSIKSPSNFIQSNIVGTFNLLEVSRNYFIKNLIKDFKFYHISSDEVYGDYYGKKNKALESSRYNPSSPYAATKAAADHLVRAWMRTYNLPILISHSTNNFGPYQNSEKLIPKTITNALNYNKIPIYGNGKQKRDWIYVDEHVNAISKVLNKGEIGESYNIAGGNQITNLNLVKMILSILDKLKPIKSNSSSLIKNSYLELLSFVDDRPGHDLRYCINANKIINKLKWKPKNKFKNDLKKTIKWYIQNKNLFN